VAGDGLPELSGSTPASLRVRSARRVAVKSRGLGCVAGLDVLGDELLATECEGRGCHEWRRITSVYMFGAGEWLEKLFDRPKGKVVCTLINPSNSIVSPPRSFKYVQNVSGSDHD
jgi:hypothetical protein